MTASLGTPVFHTPANGNGPVTDSATVTIGANDSLFLAITSTSSVTLTLTCSGATVGTITPTLIGTVVDTVTHQQTKYYYAIRPGADTYTITSSVPGGTTNAYVGEMGVAVQGAAAASILVASSGNNNFQSGPGTGTDAVTSGVAQTPSGYSCLVIGLALDDDVAGTPVTGTGFTSAGTGWQWELGLDGARLESKRITSGTAQATFTAPTGAGTSHYVTLMAVFLESGSAVPPDSMFFGSGSVG